MIDNELVKKMILKNNDLYKALGVETVPFFADDKTYKCNMSALTPDEMVYVNANYNIHYDEPMFAFRNWNKVNSIIGMFSDDFDIKVDCEYDTDLQKDCPSLIRFNSPTIKVKHYLQPYKYFKIQVETNAYMKKSKFILTDFNNSNITINSEALRQISKASSIMDDKQFRFKVEDNQLYAIIGDEEKSIDAIRILVGTSELDNFTTNLISFEYFNVLYKSYMKMKGETFIKLYTDKVTFCNKEDAMTVTSILRTKIIKG